MQDETSELNKVEEDKLVFNWRMPLDCQRFMVFEKLQYVLTNNYVEMSNLENLLAHTNDFKLIKTI